MTMLTFAATAASVAFILLLALGDPKRRRAAGLSDGHGRGKRYLHVLGALLPGLLIALIGDAATWLIWFGGCAVAGWLAALWLAKPAARVRSRN
jgi:hypothetical protein